MQQACRCVQNVLYAVSAVEGLGGRPSIRKSLLARAGVIDEELWGSQLDGWHLHMGRGQLGLLYDRGRQCGRELHPMREGPPLFTLSTQLTSLWKTHFLINYASTSLGWGPWAVPHSKSWKERKQTLTEKGSRGRDLWAVGADIGIFLPSFLILCYFFLVCPWKETNCH